MKEIELTYNMMALIDNEDFEDISKYKWSAVKLKSGYNYYAVRVDLDGHNITMHSHIMKPSKGQMIDHKDGNGLNNQRKTNLRFCTKSQNMMNKNKYRGLSKYKGVTLDKSRNKWSASITLNHKRVHLGRFNMEKDAALAYNQKATELFGEFARLNIL